MTTDSPIPTADDTKVEEQVAAPTADTPEAQPGNPAQPTPQGDAAGNTETPAGETVEYELAVPEGVEADAEVLEEFKGLARDLKLSQEDAQKLADLSAKVEIKRQEAFKAQQVKWIDAAKSDKEFGGEQFAENLAVAKRALDAFAPAEMRQLLTDSGLGNHPEVIRCFVRIGKQISEDGAFPAGNAPNSQGRDARRLYAASNMNP